MSRNARDWAIAWGVGIGLLAILFTLEFTVGLSDAILGWGALLIACIGGTIRMLIHDYEADFAKERELRRGT